jgi:hypothetical protein
MIYTCIKVLLLLFRIVFATSFLDEVFVSRLSVNVSNTMGLHFFAVKIVVVDRKRQPR